MRTEASIKNSIIATCTMLMKILIGFLAQKIFVIILNTEYLGANGLFSNVITLLSLAELGVGQAICFSMYKPIARNDKETIKSLMNLYKKAYNVIGLIVLLIGIGLIPFLDLFIGETTLNLNFTLVYLLFLMQCVMSYLFTYKRTILYAYQENYIISSADCLYVLFSNIAQLSILFITKNYYLYLIIRIICVLIENIAISYIADKKYIFLKEKSVKKLDENLKVDIIERIKATFFHKIGSVIVAGTDNIIISKFLGLATVGLYSNYYMIMYYLGEIIRQMIASVTPSVGNLLVEGEKQKNFQIYKRIEFFNFWLATFSATAIFVIVQSFIKIWMGSEYLLAFSVVVVLVINYYLKTMRQTNDVFINAAGICVETKYVPILESCVNIIFSILLLKLFGLAGVFMGTIISSIPLWCYTYPKFVYKKLIGGEYIDYAKENITFLIVFILIAVVTYGISLNFAFPNLLFDIVANAVLCMIVPNFILFLLFRKTEEFEYFMNLIKLVLSKKKVLK